MLKHSIYNLVGPFKINYKSMSGLELDKYCQNHDSLLMNT